MTTAPRTTPGKAQASYKSLQLAEPAPNQGKARHILILLNNSIKRPESTYFFPLLVLLSRIQNIYSCGLAGISLSSKVFKHF